MPKAKKKPAKRAPLKKSQNFFIRELLILLVVIGVFIGIRSIHYTQHLNFSGDQALFSIEALKIYETQKPTLVGPPVSMSLHGRQVFQGPATYYEFLAFLVLGGFDPVRASYIFMLFAAVMVIPLYFGLQMLFGRRSAIIVTALYTLLPYYIDFSRFLWNPTFQFVLLPVLLFLMGLYKRKRNSWIILGLAVVLGILLQYHYQFGLVIGFLFLYYLLVYKIRLPQILLFALGIGLGFAPVLLFEARNQFYNAKTALLFLQKLSEVKVVGGGKSHYYLSLSFLALILLVGAGHKYLDRMSSKTYTVLTSVLCVGLLIWAVSIYTKKPTSAFWSPAVNWNYEVEYNTYKHIRDENLQDYNVANIAYDNNSMVVKYLLKKDGIRINYDDYTNNRYLFVVARKNLEYMFMDDPAYAIQVFRPYVLRKTWAVSPYYNLYLVEKTKK